jgi:hypothetical protein
MNETGTIGLRFDPDGAECIVAALADGVLAALDAAFAGLPADRAGIRLTGIPRLGPILSGDGPVGAVAAKRLGPAARPVRAVLFDKNAQTNWRIGWHQDRTIAVRARREAPGFGPWSIKAGLTHVAPPFELLAGMVTLRVHLDPVGPENAPLLVARGSHRLGRVVEAEIVAAVRRCGTAACLAERGDIWLYATPILHASDTAAQPARRRVLQVDYAACELPSGLAWLGL